MDAGRPGLRVLRQLVADERPVGLGRPVEVSRHEPRLHPRGVVGVGGVHGQAAPVAALDRPQRHLAAGGEVEAQEGVGGLRPVLVGEEERPLPVGRGEDRPHRGEPRLEVGVGHGALGERVAVEELDELGEPHLAGLGQAGEGRAEVHELVLAAGAGEGARPRAGQAVGEAQDRAVLGEAEADLQAERGVLAQRAPERVLEDAVREHRPAPRPGRSRRARRSPAGRRAGRRGRRTAGPGPPSAARSATAPRRCRSARPARPSRRGRGAGRVGGRSERQDDQGRQGEDGRGRASWAHDTFGAYAAGSAVMRGAVAGDVVYNLPPGDLAAHLARRALVLLAAPRPRSPRRRPRGRPPAHPRHPRHRHRRRHRRHLGARPGPEVARARREGSW